MDHSHLPWTCAGSYILSGAHGGFTVADVETFTGRSVCPEPERRANAEFIVLAVNNHENMVDLLESLHHQLTTDSDLDEITGKEKYRGFVEDIEEILTKVDPTWPPIRYKVQA